MKDTFLVNLSLPDVFTQKFYALIPLQRAHVKNLLEQQVILSYALDMERKNIWLYISANSEREVMDVLADFPIIKEVKVTVHELAFYDFAHQALPDLIMN